MCSLKCQECVFVERRTVSERVRETGPHLPLVDVVVPVYKGYEATRRCIESVLSADYITPINLVLIDDASPEQELVCYLNGLSGQDRISVLRNPHNLGFVQSVNRGMRLHPERDVVLLNSDTEVANDWLDRLRACACSAQDIATVTPFSNNATICSYPVFCADNPMPSGIELAELDGLFARINAGGQVDLPTAVGFCMYIRRACLDAIGLFDAERFGRGYGEENDFSRRAAKAGWRNVLCADTFVFHAGGVSFGNERAALAPAAEEVLASLHPDYAALVRRFVAEDAPAKYRQAVDMELARRRMGLLPASSTGAARLNKPVQLHVVHDLGGGIARWCEDYCQADDQRINLVLKPYRKSQAMGEGLVLLAGREDAAPLGLWQFEAPIAATADRHAEYRKVLASILHDYGVDAILVSSLIGHALDVLDTGLPTVLVQHDFYPYCPAIHIYFDGVCQTCDAERLTRCAEQNPSFNPAHRFFTATERLRIRERFVELIEQRNLTLVVPSQAARAHFNQLLPQLDPSRFVTIPHGHLARLSPVAYPIRSAHDTLRVVVLGMLSVSKGVDLLRDALEPLLEFAEVHLVGPREMGVLFEGKQGVHVVSDYSLDDLPAILSEIQPDAALLLSIVPETFSYTLSELFMLGIPPVATNLGSFAERITPGVNGFLVEPCAESLLSCLRDLRADRVGLQRIRAHLLQSKMRTAQEMVADYHRLLPLDGGRQAPAWLHAEPGKLDDDRMAQALVLSAQWRDIQRLKALDEMKSARLGELRAHLEELEHARNRLETVLHETRQILVSRDAGIAALHASTSWRVTAPLRWVGRRTRQARIFVRCLGHALQQPQRLPEWGRALLEAWRTDGVGGVKHVMLRWPEVGQDSRDVHAVSTIEPDASLAHPDWRQSTFRHYRASLTEEIRGAIRARAQAMPAAPLISVLVPTYNTPVSMLRDMLDSVCNQLYPHWQLCAADDASSLPHVRSTLADYANRDARIRLDFADGNGGVARTTNRALAMAEGDFVVLLDHDDMLEEQALFRVAQAVLADVPDMLYSDEVLVGEDGRTVQHFIFRPMFSPEYLRAHPYIVHLIGFRTGFLRELGGLDESLRISQDYDLILRASERAKKIVHIPEILYRWRIHGASAGHAMIDKVMETSSGILRRHLQRCGEAGEVTGGASFNFFDVRYPLASGLKVAIIIPTKNHAELVRACIESIERTAGGVAHEIVLVDHESDDPAALACFDSLRARVTLLRYQGPFNFAAINNWAVAQLNGRHTHYLFCNNDVEAIEPGWLDRMLELGQKTDVGVVGAKLYYPDRKTIQHAGVVVACCGVAENLGRFRETSDAPPDLGYLGSLVCNREVSAVTGACMLVRRNVFDEIGGFDEAIAVGYGDVDLCLRAGQQGYRTLFCAHAVLLHHESYTRGRTPEDPHPEDSARFLAKWQAAFAAGDLYFNPNLSSHSPNWQVAEPLEVRSDVPRRLFVRGQPPAHLE